MKIAFIGAGVMAEAIISGLISKGSARPEDITASDISEIRLTELAKRHGIECVADNLKSIKGKDIVVFCVKPQVFNVVADDLHGRLESEQLALSIMAGIKIDTINMLLGHHSIVRVMPNTPAQIGEGISVWTATDTVSRAQRDMVQSILEALGKEIYLDSEKYVDMATAVSGSGPAYVFMIIESFIDAAVHIGLPRDTASELVMQTMLGSLLYARASGRHLGELRDMVTSPGGTTAEGLLKLEDGGLRAVIIQAVVAAYEKAQKLGREH
ncbi:MAG: pyrroline-5-carboxylate reductase [Dehalococcoidia bacterium]